MVINEERVLVTGATGFIGSATFKHLRAVGYAVDGLSLHGGEVDGETISSVDITSEKALASYTKGKSYKAIFHIAACIPQSFDLPESEGCFYPNIFSVKNILKLASSQKDCHVLYASSVSVYGMNQEVPLSEVSAPMPNNYYTLSKYVGELLCQLYSGRLPVTVLRISSPYGPGYKRQTVINIFCREAIRSGNINLFGSGRRRQDFVYIDDIVDAFVLSFKNCCTGVFNICSGNSVSMHDLANLVLSLVPASKSKIVFSGQSDPNESFHGVYSIEKSVKLMGFIPKTSLAEGLKRHLSWFESMN